MWAIHKCNFFLKGIEKFKVVTDHRPLIGILAKAMPQIENTRITRLREKVLDYPFEVTWVAGKDNVIADALSRAPSSTTEGATSLPVHSCIIAPQSTITQLQDSCRADPAYQQIVDTFRHGKHLADIPADHPARRLKQVWDQISLTNEGILIVDGCKLYLPPGIPRKNVLAQLHKGHCGYGKTLQTARSLYYWPSMKYDIKTMVDNCETCQQLCPSKPVKPFITTKAKFPMKQISIDLFHVKGKTYMVIADRFSGYIWIEMLRSQNTASVTAVIDKITRIFGIPLVCRTDGGPQFRGPFKDYCFKKGIIHETSSPYNPRSNGHAEAAVKTAKYLLLKTRPSDFDSALAAWRNTAREDRPSPNELMFCRKVRDEKAVIDSQLHIQVPEKDNHRIHESISSKKQNNPTNSTSKSKNASSHQIPECFQQGDKVCVQDPCTKRWDRTALVTGFSRTGRTLELLTDKGGLIVRNRRFIRQQCAAWGR